MCRAKQGSGYGPAENMGLDGGYRKQPKPEQLSIASLPFNPIWLIATRLRKEAQYVLLSVLTFISKETSIEHL